MISFSTPARLLLLLLCAMAFTVQTTAQTTWTVTTTANSGAGSLRNIMTNVSNGDTVRFAVTGDIIVSSTSLTWAQDVFIEGPGADLLTIRTISGSHFPIHVTGGSTTMRKVRMVGKWTRAMYFTGNALTLDSCAIDSCLQSSLSDGGGGLYAIGTDIALLNCSFSNNERRDNSKGGAVYCYGTSSVMIENCLFDKNKVEDQFSFTTSSIRMDGGGLWAGSTNLTVRNCTFTENMCFIDGISGWPVTAVAEGGAARLGATDSLLVENCVFDNNAGICEANTYPREHGQALFIASQKAATVRGNTFTNHDHGTPNNAYAAGGAIYAAVDHHLTLEDNTYDNAYARYGAAVYVKKSVSSSNPVIWMRRENIQNTDGYQPYGAVYLFECDSVFVRGCYFNNNPEAIENQGLATRFDCSETTFSTGLTGISVNAGLCYFVNNTFDNITVGALNDFAPSSSQTFVTNCTFYNNGSDLLSSGSSHQLVLKNNLFSYHGAGTPPTNTIDASVTAISQGGNIERGSSLSTYLNHGNDLSTTNPQLSGTLTDHGGLVPTIALLATGPAVDHCGTDTLAVDGRGYLRSGNIDCGAYEVGASDPAQIIVNSTSSDTTVCAAQQLALSVSATSGPALYYQWHKNGTPIGGATANQLVFASLALADSGAYTCVISNTTNSDTTTAIALQVLALPSVSTSNDTLVCPGDSVQLAGNSSGTLLWNNSLGSNPMPWVQPVVPTMYLLTATGGNGCTNTDSVLVDMISQPMASISGTAAVCPGDTATLSATGGTSYSWSSGGSGTMVQVTPSSTQTYFVTATDALGCTSISQTTVLVYVPPTVVANSSASTICLSDSVALSGSGASTYQWTQSVVNGNYFTPATTQQYHVVGTDTNGCTNSDAVIVTVVSYSTSASTTDSVLCTGDSVALSVPGASSVSWDQGVAEGVYFFPSASNTYTAIAQDGNGCLDTVTIALTVNVPTITANSSSTTVCTGAALTLWGSGGTGYSWSNGVPDSTTFFPTGSATYTVVGTDAHGCLGTDSVAVAMVALPTADAGNDTLVCEGDSVQLSGSGGLIFAWSPTATLTGSGTPTPVATPAASTTYTLSVTDGNGCTGTDQVVVSVLQAPQISITASATSVCLGDSATLTASGAPTIGWSGGISNGNAFAPTATQAYVVTASDAFGCTSDSAITIAVQALPTVVANASAAAVCVGDSLTLSGSGASTYAWTGGATNGQAFAPVSAQTYLVTGTDTNGCSGTDSVAVAVQALPTANAGNDTSLCAGGSVQLQGSGGLLFAWSPASSLSNASSASPLASPASTTQYTLSVTDAAGCVGTDLVQVTVQQAPSLAVSASDTAVCLGDSVTLTGSGAATLAWNGGISNGVAFMPIASQTFTLTGTDANGCPADTSIYILVESTPSVSANASASSVCAGDSVTLSATGAASYTWSNGITNGVAFVPAVTDSYLVTGSTVAGCTDTASISVIVHTLPSVVVQISDSSVCEGELATLTGVGASTYVWSAGVVDGQPFVPTSTDIYSVTGTDANGCTSTATSTMVVHPLPTVQALTSDTAVCAGETVTLSGSGAMLYIWPNGIQNGVPFTPAASASYTVDGVDGNGCSNTASVFVEVLDNPSAGFLQNINGDAVSFVNISSNAQFYQWLFGDGGASTDFEPTHTYAGGNYLVQLIAINSCGSDTADTEITVVGINAPSASAEMRVFPNPARETINIQLEGTQMTRIVLRTSTGQVALQQEGAYAPQAVLRTDGLPAGIYLLEVHTSKGVHTARLNIIN